MIETLLIAGVLYAKAAELPEYRGDHYTRRAERYLECVASRESSWPRKSSWDADGPTGSGAFQIIGRTWDYYAERAGFPEWIGIRPANAPPYIQTHIAYVMVNPFPERKGLHGKHHWSPKHALTVGKRIEAC